LPSGLRPKAVVEFAIFLSLFKFLFTLLDRNY
jgi:hypothetical protein